MTPRRIRVPGSPLGTMVCWHRRYALGDAHHYSDPQAFSREVTARTAVILPLYLFDHSGLTISTSSGAFRACDPAGWDWGQVGISTPCTPRCGRNSA